PLWMLQAEEQAEESAEIEWEVSEHKGDPRFVLMSVGRLRKLAHALVVQLSGEVVAPELGNQVVKNLYFIAKCFLTAVPAVTPVVSLVAADEQDVMENQDNDEEEEEEEDEEEDVKADRLPLERSLLWLINRMGRLARTELIRDQTNTTKRTYTFRYFAALTALLPASILSQSPYLLPIISPLHRTSSSPDQLPTTTGDYPTAPVFNEQTELRDLASQVLRLVQERVGVTLFSSVLNKVQRHVEGVRLERKERRKQLALVDPELHAKRKFRKHENDRRRRQEKEADSTWR
ncbi:U3 snoRNP protein, partial [Kickxella alabastrina]